LELSAQTNGLSVDVDALSAEPFASILCYPRPDPEEVAARIQELKTLGVEALIFDGRSRIGRLRILGKGCVSIVVKGKTSEGECAVKIRRVDANRPSMSSEALLHQIANEVDVGPKLYASSGNFILMELVDGSELVDWVRNLRGPGSTQRLRDMIKTVLDQCYRLDKAGLDHGELSNLKKHVYLDGKVFILDFETSSNRRRARNLTSAIQFLFIGGTVARKIRWLLNLIDIKPVFEALVDYKNSIDDKHYEKLLTRLKLMKKRKS
jgi:putative serine/threonine protein kinase